MSPQEISSLVSGVSPSTRIAYSTTKALGRGLEFAARFGVPQLHCLSGVVPPELDLARAEATYLENLTWAATQAEAAGVRLLIEPINDTNTPGYFLTRCAEAKRIIATVNSSNLFIQYDCYHGAMMGEPPMDAVKAYNDLIRHVQISGVPDRHEPDKDQDIDYGALFRVTASLDYAGWFGCEYRPRATTMGGLAWLADYV